MQSHLLISCLLLSLTLSWSNAAPTPSTRANGPHDVRWRLVSGMETLFKYTIKLQQQSCGSEPLLNVNDRLKPILSGVCRLLEVHELATRVRNGSNLHAVLGQNILDSCDWVNHLVNRSEVTATERFLNLSDSCELGNMPRLSQYCLEDRIRTNPNLCNDVNERIYTPISNYYSGTVVDTSIPAWLEATSISTHQRHSIESTLMQTYPCTS